MYERDPNSPGPPPPVIDKSFFSPLADLAHNVPPPCHACDKPSIGATLDEIKPSTTNRLTVVARFSCGCTGMQSWAITSHMLYPRWLKLADVAKGVLLLRHLTEPEAEKRVTGG